MLLYQSRQRQAGVAELADALDSGSSGSNLVEVQVLSPALQAIIQWVVAFLYLCELRGGVNMNHEEEHLYLAVKELQAFVEQYGGRIMGARLEY